MVVVSWVVGSKKGDTVMAASATILETTPVPHVVDTTGVISNSADFCHSAEGTCEHTEEADLYSSTRSNAAHECRY